MAVDNVDLNKYQDTISRAVSRTRQVQGPSKLDMGGWNPIFSPSAGPKVQVGIPGLGGIGTKMVPANPGAEIAARRNKASMASAAAKDYETKYKSTQAEANRAADALAMRGAASVEKIQSLRAARENFMGPEAKKDYLKRYEEATKLAGTYVDSANVRLSHFMGTMDNLLSEQEGRLELARVQDIESAVYVLEGNLDQEWREYMANPDTKSGIDYETQLDFHRAKRRQQHSAIRSSISPAYAKLEQDFRQAHMAATQQGYTDLSMHISFREQQHIEAKQAEAAAGAKYKLDVMNLDMLVADSIGKEYEDTMNWILQSPVSSVDTLPMMLAISEYSQGQDNEARAAAMSDLNYKVGAKNA